MSAFNNITDQEIASGKPVTSSLIQRLRDNLFAVIEGNTPPERKISWSAFTLVPGLNQEIKDAAGAYNFTVPAGVTVIKYEAVGAGGGACLADGTTAYPGNGGEKRYGALSVTPGETLSLTVGAKGAGRYNSAGDGTRNAGTDTTIYRGGVLLVRAKAGSGAEGGYGGFGGNGIGGMTNSKTYTIAGGDLPPTTASGHSPGGYVGANNTDPHPGCGGPCRIGAGLGAAGYDGFDGLIILNY